MKATTISALVIIMCACSPAGKQIAGNKNEEFIKQHFQSCKRAYERAFHKEVRPDQVRAMEPKEFVAFVKDRGWGKSGIPCEISGAIDIGNRPGVTDPSPIAMEVFPADPGERSVFLPTNVSSSCKGKRGFIIPAAGCSHGWDDVEIQCDGQTSDEKSCTDPCICRAVCGEGNDNCTPCG